MESTKDFNTLQKFNDNMRRVKMLFEKKKQDKVSSTLTTLINLLTDLNYLPALSLLETMV